MRGTRTSLNVFFRLMIEELVAILGLGRMFWVKPLAAFIRTLVKFLNRTITLVCGVASELWTVGIDISTGVT